MKKTKTKCYLYTRVSTSMQVDGYSLDAQRDKLRKYAEYEETFVYGNVEPVYEDTDTVFGFMRMGKENRQKILVAANYGKEAVSLPLPGTAKKLLLSNAGRRKLADADHITLESLETAVVLLKA